MKNKLIISCLFVSLCCLSAYAQDLTMSDLIAPKPPAYRVGLTDQPENQYIEAEYEKIEPEKIKKAQKEEENAVDLTYADLSLKKLSQEIAGELEYEEKSMVADLSLLWQGAAMQSDTINFALYKLANPDADKPDQKSIKKVLTTIASMSTILGAGLSNPIVAGSSLIGGNVLGIMGQDTKALNYKYTKVSDADMIILVRKIEDLQQKTIDLYYDYITARQQVAKINKIVEERQNKFDLVQKNNAPRELVVIVDAYYRTSLDRQRNAQSEYYVKRAALEQFVGNETFTQFEEELTAREKGETLDKDLTPEEEKEYDQTIKDVENYINEINSSNNNDKDSTQAPTGFAVNIDNDTVLAPIPMLETKKEKKNKLAKLKTNIKEKVKKEKEIKSEKAKTKKEKTQEAKDSQIENKSSTKTVIKKKNKKIKRANKPVTHMKIQSDTVDDVKSESIVAAQKTTVEEDFTNAKTKDKNKVKSKKEKKTKVEKPQKVKKEKVKKEKTKEEKAKTEKNEKDKSVKSKKQTPTRYYDVQPHKTYPKNSTKDLIFLHGKDKNSFKSSLTPDGEIKTTSVDNPNSTSNSTTTTSPTAVNAVNAETPVQHNTFEDELRALPPLDPIGGVYQYNNQPGQQPLTRIDNQNLLPLDSIKVPEIQHGSGYSIYSDYDR